MTERTADLLRGVSVGCLVLGALIFVLDAVLAYHAQENVLAAGLFAVGLVGIGALGMPRERSTAPQRNAVWVVGGILVSLLLATAIIRGDIRSWFLVGLVVVTALLLIRERKE